jgi:hypothetical protein
MQFKEIALGKGRWRPADDPATIAPEDFVDITNLRYGPTNPEGVGGMTKINTAALATTGIKNGIHFRKDRPVESHVVVHTPSDGKVWKNDTAIPTAGAFNGTAIFTGSTGHGNGRFSLTPQGGLAFCNGVDSVFWGGDEFPCAAFVDFPTTSQAYDYTDQVTNTKTTSDEVATIHTTQSTIDAATMLLLHLDNNVTDSSPTTAHTVTNTNVTFSTSSKFGTHAAVFNGTNARLSIPDDADFDFSDGTWTLDFWMKATTWADGDTIFYQGTDATNYIKLETTYSHPSFDIYRRGLKLTVVATTATVTLEYPYLGNQIGNWIHVAIVEDGDAWYMFVDGVLKATVTGESDRAANYTGVIYIGNDGGTSWYDGAVDELRISNTARWTAAFTVPSAAYGPSYISTTYIGSIMPLDGMKLYVATTNPLSSGTATMAMNEWDGSAWTPLAITDNTALSSRALEQTGAVTWATTASTSKPRIVEKRYLYWYQMIITSASDFTGATISQVNVSIPPQQIKDLWDGSDVAAIAFLGNKSGSFEDATVNVSRNEYDSANAGTYFKMISYTTSDYILVGFNEQVSGIRINIVDTNPNILAVVASVSYWGSTSSATAPAWTTLSATDETLNGTKSFNKSGYLYWNPPTAVQEFRQSEFSSSPTASAWKKSTFFPPPKTVPPPKGKSAQITGAYPIYYYKIAFSGTTSADVRISYAAGIPAPASIRGYVQPDMFQSRLALICNKDGKKNTAIVSAPNTINVFNGELAQEFEFGDDKELVASSSLFTRYGSVMSEQWVVCKNSETWVVAGTGTDNDPFVQRKITDYVGCTAPYTMAEVPIGIEDKLTGTLRTALIWQSSDGIYMFDGSSAPVKISRDIRHFFDPKRGEYLTAAVLTTCFGDYDPVYNAYVWIVPDSAEYHYSLEERKWYKVSRGADKELNCCFPVQDSNGQYYNFGCSNAGFMYRLENGTTFDGVAIAQTIQLGDAALQEGRVSRRSEVRSTRLIGKAKSTASTVAVSFYLDSSTTAYSPTVTAMSMQNTGKRLFNVFRSFGNNPLTCTFVSPKFVVSTSDETKGFEPMYAVIGFKDIGPDVR